MAGRTNSGDRWPPGRGWRSIPVPASSSGSGAATPGTGDVSRTPGDHHARRGSGHRRADAGLPRWSFASMWTPGPFESRPRAPATSPTSIDGRPIARTSLHGTTSRRCGPSRFTSLSRPLPALPASSPRRVKARSRSCLRRRRLSKAGRTTASDDDEPGSGGRTTPSSRTAGRSAGRLVHFVVCIKLHAEDMSGGAGVRCFREDAFMEGQRVAKRSAVRSIRSRLHRRQADAAEAAAGH